MPAPAPAADEESEGGGEGGSRLVVTIPEGVEAGEHLLVEAPSGNQLQVRVDAFEQTLALRPAPRLLVLDMP